MKTEDAAARAARTGPENASYLFCPFTIFICMACSQSKELRFPATALFIHQDRNHDGTAQLRTDVKKNNI
jgi:hypothetical protein